MQLAVLSIFLGVWLLVFWVGSVALEMTGMERTKARFQALSAMSGTGFTTRESELVVSHPKRRRIIGWLIFLGNAGIISFIILVIVFVRVGLKAPSPYYLGILLGVVALIALLIKLKVIDKLTSSLIRLARRRRPIPLMVTEELLYQNADYGVAHIAVGEKAGLADTKLKDTGLFESGITVLAIERGREVIPSPKPEETVLAGDYLLCYGKVTVMTNVAR